MREEIKAICIVTAKKAAEIEGNGGWAFAMGAIKGIIQTERLEDREIVEACRYFMAEFENQRRKYGGEE